MSVNTSNRNYTMEVEYLLSEHEKTILQLIKNNPFVTVDELVETSQLEEATVLESISLLKEMNMIQEPAYLINEKADVICVGGMNVDRKYNIQGTMMLQTSNPVVSDMTVGGVARNVAENLGRLDQNVVMLSVAGCDADFEWIKKQTEPFVDMSLVTQLENQTTGSYTAILDIEGEMQLGLADMSIYDLMTVEWVDQFKSLLISAKLIVLDLNIPLETVEYLIKLSNEHDLQLVVIPTSSPKMDRLPSELSGVDTIVVNEDESETFFKFNVIPEDNDFLLVDKWLETGINQVILTRGSRSSLYGNKDGVRKTFYPPHVNRVIDVTGAGDSYVAGFIAGQLMGESFEKSVEFAMTNANATIQSPETVRSNLSLKGLINEHAALKEAGM